MRATLGEHTEVAMTEKRKATRQKSFLRGIVYFDQNTTSIECLVRDISDAGARLKLPNSQSRSGAVDIAIPINGKHYKGTIQWQRDDEIGIAFTTADTALTNDKRDANAGKGSARLGPREGFAVSPTIPRIEGGRRQRSGGP